MSIALAARKRSSTQAVRTPWFFEVPAVDCYSKRTENGADIVNCYIVA
jgi:hypothetical protein